MNGAARRKRQQEEQEERAFAEMAAKDGGLPPASEFDENDELVPSGGRDEQEQDEPKIPPFWRKRRVARHFGVHYKTIEGWVKKYALPCFKVGGTLRFDISDVLRWASARKEGV
jgi:excisionase family DNA binding protein